MYILIILYMGDMQLVKICLNQQHAQTALANWIRDNWHAEDSSPEDFETEEMIEWYFDNYEDYSCYREPIVIPAPVQSMQDVLLTPGMCAVVREGLEHVDFVKANDILIDNDEWNEVQDGPKTGADLIAGLIKQFG